MIDPSCWDWSDSGPELFEIFRGYLIMAALILGPFVVGFCVGRMI